MNEFDINSDWKLLKNISNETFLDNFQTLLNKGMKKFHPNSDWKSFKKSLIFVIYDENELPYNLGKHFALLF